jgi:hypothetical protein
VVVVVVVVVARGGVTTGELGRTVGTGMLDEDEGEGMGGVKGVTMGGTSLVLVVGFATDGILVGLTGMLLDGLMDRSEKNVL